MLLECLTRRVGPTEVTLKKVRYTFMPVPDPRRKRDEPSTSYCDVHDPGHIDFLLKSGTFREYQEGQAVPMESVINLSGYSIRLHHEGRMEGYRAENNNVKPTQYAGADMVWKESAMGLVPFSTEFMAWQFLKDYVASKGEDARADEIFAEVKRSGRPRKEDATDSR